MKSILNLTLVVVLLLITSIVMPADVHAQQSRSISGVVIDATDNEPIIGANVIISGTTVGVITDTDGKFQLSVPSGKSTLDISYLGYQSQTVSIGSQSSLTVKLVVADQSLDEIVVVGYGTVKKRDLTGAVSSVKGEDITMAPVTNPIEAIQGRVAGLDISRIDGKVGSKSKIVLRGNRSLTADNDPLYIIDGIVGDIDYLNPNDIATIDILKDASSTAIYGSAGANGVIIITTKQADKGKMQVDFSSYVGINSNPSYPKALKGEGWLNYLKEGYRSTYPDAEIPNTENLLSAYSYPAAVLPYVQNGQWVDWVDESLRTGIQQDYNISVRGGNEALRGYFSLAHNNNQGVFLNDQAKRYTMRAGLNTTIKPWMSAGIQTGLTFGDNNARNSRINRAFSALPLGKVYDDNGEINPYPIDSSYTSQPGISLIADNVPGAYAQNTKRIHVTVNPFVEFTFMKGLTLKSILGTNLGASRRGTFNSDHTYMALTGSQSRIKNALYETTLNYNYTWENILNYNTAIAKDHSLGATLVSSWAYRQDEKSSASSSDFMYDEFLWYSLQGGINPLVTSNYSMTKMMSYTGRLNYSYKGKYLLNVSVRTDGASQLVKRRESFPAFAAAWRISDENFMANTKSWLHNLKFRVGYGVTGNSNISPYSSKTEATSSGLDQLNLGGSDLISVVPTQTVGNATLTWEKSFSTNIGLDISLFKNRIEATIDWYNTNTEEILYKRDLPFTSGGFTSKLPYQMTGNIAQMHNRGIELTLNTRNIITKNFRWTSALTFARNQEEVTAIDLGSSYTVDKLKDVGLFIGSPKNTVYGYKKLGIWQENEAVDAAVFGLKPGDVKVQTNLTKISDGVWEDRTKETPVQYTVDNKYGISANDRTIIGQIDPKWAGGFQNSFYYKGFDLNLFLVARWGQVVNNSLLGYFGREAMPETYNYWTPENPTNDFPRYYLQRANPEKTDPKLLNESLTIVDGSYLKLKNITLGYELPRNLSPKIGISKLRVYGTLYNAFMFNNSPLLKNIDPEGGQMNTKEDPRAATKATGDSFPLYRQMVFGINISF